MDDWVDYEPPRSAAPPQDDWVDYQPAREPPSPQAQATPSQDDWVDYQPLRQPREPAPEAEGMLATGLRAFAHEAPAAAAGAAGAMYGAGLGAPAGLPGAIIGGLAGGFAGGYGGAAAAGEGLKLLGVDDAAQLAVNAKTNPWSAAIGQGAAQVLGFGAGAAPAAARIAGAGIGGALEAGQQVYQGEFDPARLATQTAAGAVFTNPYKWGRQIETAGTRAGEQIAEGYRARTAEKLVPEEPQPRQLQYHGSAASEASAGVAQDHLPPRKEEPNVGNPQNAPTRSGKGEEYYEPPTPKGEVLGVQTGDASGMDATVRSVLETSTAAAEPARPAVEPPPVGPAAETPRPPAVEEPTRPGTLRELIADEQGGGRLPSDATIGEKIRQFIADERGGGRIGKGKEGDLEARTKAAADKFSTELYKAEKVAEQAGKTRDDYIEFLSPEGKAALREHTRLAEQFEEKKFNNNYKVLLDKLPEGYTATREKSVRQMGDDAWREIEGTRHDRNFDIRDPNGDVVGGVNGTYLFDKDIKSGWFKDFIAKGHAEPVMVEAMRAAREAGGVPEGVIDLNFERARPDLQQTADALAEASRRPPGKVLTVGDRLKDKETLRRQGKGPPELPEGFTLRQTPGGRHVLEAEGRFMGDFGSAPEAIRAAGQMERVVPRETIDLQPVYENLVQTKGQAAADRWLKAKHAQAGRYETGNLLPQEAARIAARKTKQPALDLTVPRETPAAEQAALDAEVAETLKTPEKISPAATPVDKTGTEALKIVKDKDSGLHLLMRGNELVGDFKTRGQAEKARKYENEKAKAREAAPEQTSIPQTVGQAVNQAKTGSTGAPAGGGAGGAGGGAGVPPPPAGAPPPAGGGNPANLGHTPPKQQGWINEFFREVQRKIAPQTLGPEAAEARRTLRASAGENQRVADQTIGLLAKHEDTIRPMSEADQAALVNHMQGGSKYQFTPTGPQRAFIRDHERAMQEWEGKLRSMPQADQMNFRDNYMAQMYENAGTRPDISVGGFGKRGGAGSTRERKYDTYEDAKDAGLIPKFTNPIDISTHYINSIKNFVISRDAINRGEASGIIQRYAAPKVVGASGSPEPLVKTNIPEGWKKLNTPPVNGRDAYAPSDFADVYNNFYDAGFGAPGTKRGDIYETIRNSSNFVTQFQLGLNTYHAFTMANEAVIHDIRSAIDLALGGDKAGAWKKLKGAPLAPHRLAFVEGKAFQKEWLNPNSTDPVAGIMAEVNARPVGRGHAADYTLQQRGSFINKFNTNNIQTELKKAWNDIKKDVSEDWAKSPTNEEKVYTVFRNVGRALQTVAAPLFDKYIPLLKAGAVSAQFKDWHDIAIKKNPNFDIINNPADRRAAVEAATKIVDDVDSRFGEAIADNMFMNKTLQQSAQAAMLSSSWFIGSSKLLGGGVWSTGKGLKRLAMSKGAENVFDPTHPDWQPRATSMLGFAIGTAATSAIYQMLFGSHDLPKDWRDIYAPRTGGTVPGVGGRGEVPEHVLLPGYQKDVVGWLHHPLQEAYNKVAGLPKIAIEQARGTDWRGDPIVRKDAGPLDAVVDRAAHFFGTAGPISAKNFFKPAEPGSNIPGWAKFIGFHAPGAYIQDPEGMERATKRREDRAYKIMTKRERLREIRQAGG